jgi:hypothetical protein
VSTCNGLAAEQRDRQTDRRVCNVAAVPCDWACSSDNPRFERRELVTLNQHGSSTGFVMTRVMEKMEGFFYGNSFQ